MRVDGESSEPGRSGGGLTMRKALLAGVVVVVVVAVLKTLSEAALPGWVAGVVSVVLSLVSVVLSIVLLARLRGRSGRPEPRPVDHHEQVVPRPPRIATAAVLNLVVLGAFAVGCVVLWLAVVFGWPVDMALDEDDRWTTILLFLPGAALFVREIVLGFRDVPRERAAVADVLAGRAERRTGTVTRRGLRGLVVAVPGEDGPVEVTMPQAVWRQRGWDPLPGDEVQLQGDLRKRGLVLVTTADGSRWRQVEEVDTSPGR